MSESGNGVALGRPPNRFDPKKKYGRLKPTVSRPAAGGGTEWLCKCDCKGKTGGPGEKWVHQRNLITKYAPTKSCGCLKSESAKAQCVRNRRIPVGDLKRVLGMRDRGWSFARIGKKFKCSYETVRKFVRRHAGNKREKRT